MSTTKDIIKQIVASMIKPAAIRGQVISVDKEIHTCEVAPLDGGAQLLDVQLRAVVKTDALGVIIYPAVNAEVIVGFVDNDLAQGYLIQMSQFESCLIALQTGFELRINSDGSLLIESDNIDLAGPDGEAAVIGETLNARLQEILDQLGSINNALGQFATTQAAASAGVLAPLAAGFSALGSSLSPLGGQISTTKSKLGNHLSDKVRLES